MPGPYATPPHRTKGSWTPRLAGVGAIVVLAGGVLAVYLGTAHGQAPSAPARHQPPLASKVASVQTVGLVDFGVYDDGDAWQNDADEHPMMLLQRGNSINFVRIPPSEIATGTPEWTEDQLTEGGDIFIYVPTGQCLTAGGSGGSSPRASTAGGSGAAGGGAAGGGLSLTHCNLGASQRWRELHSEVILTEPIVQYANVSTGRCLTAGQKPGPASLTICASPRNKRFKSQEIAFWWSA